MTATPRLNEPEEGKRLEGVKRHGVWTSKDTSKFFFLFFFEKKFNLYCPDVFARDWQDTRPKTAKS